MFHKKEDQLFKAIAQGDLAAVQAAVEAGANISHHRDWYGHPAEYALNQGKVDIAVFLAKKGGAVSSDYALSAAKKGHVKFLRATLNAATDSRRDYLLKEYYEDSPGNYMLHMAAKQGQLAVVKMLIEEFNADPNQPNKDNRTAFYVAERAHREDVVEYLRPLTDNAPQPEKTGWVPLSTQEIAFVDVKTAIGYKITEIFNFESGTYTKLAQPLEQKNAPATPETKFFDDFLGNVDILEKALKELNDNGGKATAEKIPGYKGF